MKPAPSAQVAPYSGDSDQEEAEPGMVTINGSNAEMDRQAPGRIPGPRALGDEVLPSIGGGQAGLARDFGEEAEPEIGQPVLEHGFLGQVSGADFGEEDEPAMEGVGAIDGQVAGSAFGLRSALRSVQGGDFDEEDPEAGPVTEEEGEGGPAPPLLCAAVPHCEEAVGAGACCLLALPGRTADARRDAAESTPWRALEPLMVNQRPRWLVSPPAARLDVEA